LLANLEIIPFSMEDEMLNNLLKIKCGLSTLNLCDLIKTTKDKRNFAILSEVDK
jgi:hypothetical protein